MDYYRFVVVRAASEPTDYYRFVVVRTVRASTHLARSSVASEPSPAIMAKVWRTDDGPPG